MVSVQALASSGDCSAWLLTTQRSEGFEAEIEMGVKMKIAGSETSAGLAKPDQTQVERGRKAAEHLLRDASIGMLETEER